MATIVSFHRGFVKMKIMAPSFSFPPWEYSNYNLIHLIVGFLAYFEQHDTIFAYYSITEEIKIH